MQKFDHVTYMKDRQKKDNHNMSKYDLVLLSFSVKNCLQQIRNHVEISRRRETVIQTADCLRRAVCTKSV